MRAAARGNGMLMLDCRDCGWAFASGITINADVRMSMVDNTHWCPRCRTPARYSTSDYHFPAAKPGWGYVTGRVLAGFLVLAVLWGIVFAAIYWILVTLQFGG